MKYQLSNRSRTFSTLLPDFWVDPLILPSNLEVHSVFSYSDENSSWLLSQPSFNFKSSTVMRTETSKDGVSGVRNSDEYNTTPAMRELEQAEASYSLSQSSLSSETKTPSSTTATVAAEDFFFSDTPKVSTSYISSSFLVDYPAPKKEMNLFGSGQIDYALVTNSGLSDIFVKNSGISFSATGSSSQFLVQFERNATNDQKTAALSVVGGKFEKIVHAADARSGDLILMSVNSSYSADAVIKALSKNPLIKFAEINAELRIQGDVTDTYYMNNSMWGMYGDKTNPYINQFGSHAGEAWASGKVGKTSVVVGNVDTGIDYTHPDLYLNIWLNQGEMSSTLKANLKDTDGDGLITFRDLNNSLNSAFVTDLNANGRIDAGDLLKDSRWSDGEDQDANGYKDDLIGWDFANNDNDPYDDNKHGTHTSGTIGAANDGTGVVGVCPNIQMMALKFLNYAGSGATSNAIQAIDYYSNISANDKTPAEFVALNNSWGGGLFSQSLLDSITRAALQDILFVAAAGNGGSDGIGDNNDTTPNYPSNYSTLGTAGYEAVFAVAALTDSGTLATFSNFGATSVDVGAPGYSILSTVPNNGYTFLSGTSMATPHVTGAFALLASYFPTYSAAQLRDLLLQKLVSTPSLLGLTTTGGRLDVSNLFGSNSSPQTPTVSVGADTLALSEGDSGTKTVTFKIMLSAPSSSDQTLNWSLSGSGNNPADISTDLAAPTSGTVTFSSSLGETQKTVTVSIVGDTQIENNEAFTFSVALPSNSTLSLGAASTTVTILNDDDNIPYTTASPSSVVVNGGTINSVIDFIGDGDAYKISLVGGTAYRFDLTATSTSTLNPYLELYDQKFSLLVSNGQGVISSSSQLIYTPTQTGTYYLGVKGSFSSIGGYVLGATDQNSLTGTTSNDVLTGTALKDTILGLSGNDSLSGGNGDDILNGGAGDDILNGGTGNDTATYEGITSSVTVSLAITSAQSTGGAGKDTLSSIENLIGGQANDTLTGNTLGNRIDGGAGNDTINGGSGNDTLIGGLGSDAFVFNTALGTSNVDTILDFNVSEDIIRLENAIMTKIGKAGTLAAGLFKIVGTAPQDSNDYILYDSQTGALSYDADANGSGAAVQFAKLSSSLALTTNNFLVI